MIQALRSRLAVRVTLTVLAVTAAGVAAMGAYVTRVLERHWVEDLKADLVARARLLHDPVAAAVGAPRRQLQALAERHGRLAGVRVTIIAPDGTVLGESARDLAGLEAMENHAGRPEVRAALAGGVGSDVRRSRTLDAPMLYVALPLAHGSGIGGILRLALPLTEVTRAASAIRRTVAAGAILAFALVLALGWSLSRRVAQPARELQAIAHRLAEGDFVQVVPVRGEDEIAGLGRALNRMAARLKAQIQALEGERATMAAILQSMAEGVIALDARGRVLFLNPAARAILGLGPGAVEGRPLVEVVRQQAVLDLAEACRGCAADEPCRREVELGPPVPRVLEARAAAVPFAPDRGGHLLVLHDVTELRRLEQVRKEFVANVSHELRTPLTSIRGYLETLLDGAAEEPGTARRFLEVAHRHAARLGRLVEDLLQLSDLEAGKAVLAPASLRVREVADEVLAIFAEAAAPKGLTLANRVPAGIEARADRDRLVQILVNLVDNAVKYTPGGGQVAIEAGRGPNGAVEVRVADTGIGIPSTDLPRLTERFYRVDRTRSREPGGTGLGLAIVKHLVQAHGGQLAIDSALGQGTTVRFTLPA